MTSVSEITLCPAQRRALEALVDAARPGTFTALIGGPGKGKSSILGEAHRRLGGLVLTSADVQTEVAKHHPLAIENALYELLSRALDANPIVLVDDLHLPLQVVEGCHSYPRGQFVSVALNALATRLAERSETLVATAAHVTASLHMRARSVGIAEFEPQDYRTIAETYLAPEQVDVLDFVKIHRFARKITASQLRRVCEHVRAALDTASRDAATDQFIDYLRSVQLVSNVDLGEVQTVKLEDLKGLDGVIRALEANVILPLEHSELATELSLKPKRGVLLAGPPGTGKTTIGRALAHRLRGKFFLVDGTVIAGTPMFYQQLHGVFEAAMRNAPSVVFIDDSDVIFEGQDPGLYRYLLTMLDGLESESAGGVCLVLTAMDVGSLPPALVRSGRIELWLETQLPDLEARRAILADLCKALPGSMGATELDELAAAAEQLSGADLKRVVEDGKLLYAFDRAQQRGTRTTTAYFLEALETVRANKRRYAQAEATARMRHPARPPHFHVPFDPGMMSDGGDVVHFVSMGMSASAEREPG
jgi:AAA+ superfamily predicted ATPase